MIAFTTITRRTNRIWNLLRTIWAFRLITFSRQHQLVKILGRIWGEKLHFRFGRRSVLILSNPTDVRQMFESDGELLSSGIGRRPFFINLFPDNTIFTASGARRQQLRKATGRAFSVANRNFDMQKTIREQLNRWHRDGVYPSQDEVDHLAISLMGRMVLGEIDESTTQLALEALRRFRAVSGLAACSPLLRRMPPWRGKVQRFRAVQAQLLSLIESACSNNATPDTTFCGQLLALSDQFDLDLECVKGSTALALLFAARSTAELLANMFHQLADNPKWQQRAREAVAESSQDGQRLLRAIVSESLRLNPVVPFMVRSVIHDCELAGVKLSKGDRVMTTPLLAHFREASFPNSEQFDPSRFLRDKITSCEFLPFGGGNTHCIGSGLVYSITTSLLQMVVEEYDCYRTSGSSADDRFVFQGVVCTRLRSNYQLIPRKSVATLTHVDADTLVDTNLELQLGL